MTKISQLGKLSADAQKSRDLFVTVSLDLGEQGTKNITRAELVKSIQQEEFDNINITGGSIADIEIDNTVISNTLFQNPDFDEDTINSFTSPMSDDDFLLLKDVSSNTVVALSYANLQAEFADTFKKANKIYVATDGAPDDEANGSYFKPYNNLEAAFKAAQFLAQSAPVSISVMPGTYFTDGNLALPDFCSIVSVSGQYSTTLKMNPGAENNNCILVGSGCYVQGFAFDNLKIDNFDDPTGGFAVAFRPGARIIRSPYVRDCSQISNYNRGEAEIAAPLKPTNSLGTIEDLGGTDHPNSLVGRGGGVLLADRSVLDQDSIFPYMLAFGATPRSPNGIGYCAKNGAGINGIGSITIFQRCAFYALNGGQITLNNSGTQFGDISMRSKGTIPVLDPYETDANNIVQSTTFADELRSNANNVIDDLWTYLTDTQGYVGYDSVKCRRDTGYILDGVGNDIVLGTNYWAVTNGIAYRRAGSSVVINSQLTETSGAISFLKSTVADLLTHAPSGTRSDAAFDEIIDILENDIVEADPLTFTDTGNTNWTNARIALQLNKSIIQDALIAWIDSNYPNLDYDEIKCRRDTGFIVDALSHDINYGGNLATLVNAEAYFVGSTSQLPTDQIEPTAAAIDQLGAIAAACILGTQEDQVSITPATQTEANRAIALADDISTVIRQNSLSALPVPIEPETDWVDADYLASREIIDDNTRLLQSLTIAFVNSEYKFLDENLTRRDAGNLIKALAFDFEIGGQTTSRNFAAGLFNYRGDHVFSVFNPPEVGLTFKGSVANVPDLPSSGNEVDDAYIVYTSPDNFYAGNIHKWTGSAWSDIGANDTDLLDAFLDAWTQMETYITGNLTINTDEETMLGALLNDIIARTVKTPSRLEFGSLIESIGHQFNLAGAGVNRNALPLNFRRVGQALAASGSVLQEDGGRVRWSGADELNNQYFARGLKINGQTGRLEGRPFTSSVRRLARRAANSRTFL